MLEAGRAPVIVRERSGFRGRRIYRIDTVDEALAHEAFGLPLVGDAWSGEYSNLLCEGADIEYGHGGTAGNPSSGWSYATVNYLTPGLNGSLPPPVAGQRWTRIVPLAETTTVYYRWDAAGNSNPFKRLPIANGQGVNKEAGKIEAHVYTYHSLAGVDIIPFLHAAEGHVNSDTVVLPAIYGTGQVFVMQPGQVRYRTFEHDLKGSDVLELVHILAISPDHLARWIQEDADGKAYGPEITDEIYEPIPMAGLW